MGEMTLTELGSFPETWSLCRVDSLFSIQQGKSVSKSNRKGINQKSFLRTKNVNWGRIDVSELDHMNFSKEEEAKLELHTGDLLLCEGGDVGRTAIWNMQSADCYYQNHLHRLRAIDSNEIIPQFALYWFWYAFKEANLYIGRSNVTTIPNMSQSKLGNLLLPRPNIKEQQYITYILSTVQNAIDQQERLIALTRELKSALMHKLFTDGLRGESQKQTEIGLIPESWNSLPLEDLLVFTQYGLSVRGEESGDFGILRMTNQLEGKISTQKMQFVNLKRNDFLKHRVEYGDLLFNRTNSYELVGRTAIFDIDGEYTFASYLIRLRANDSLINPFFLNHYLNWEVSQKRLKSIASRAISQSNISATRLGTFQIPVPSLEEQVGINLIIESIIKKIETHQRKKKALEELFRTLLNELMTGQIKPNEINIDLS